MANELACLLLAACRRRWSGRCTRGARSRPGRRAEAWAVVGPAQAHDAHAPSVPQVAKHVSPRRILHHNRQ